jgi:hypothetical protein
MVYKAVGNDSWNGSFRSSPRCRNGAVYGTRGVGEGSNLSGEVARQADTPASVVSTHRGQVAQIEWGMLDLDGR